VCTPARLEAVKVLAFEMLFLSFVRLTPSSVFGSPPQPTTGSLGPYLGPLATDGVVQSYPNRVLAPPDHQTPPASLLVPAPPPLGQSSSRHS
jgi:hypothetical protein